MNNTNNTNNREKEIVTTYIVNVKVKYIRPKYNNLKEWMKDPLNVYIGRRGIVFIDGARFPEKSSVWSNPFKINKNRNRGKVIKMYKKYIVKKIIKEDMFSQLLELKNKNLGCWCHPEKCHGDVLIELMNDESFMSKGKVHNF